ncbi:DUF192 domain-containing protein [Massilia brevitalea]|uniref:DUF192 domain-containing protein n=1 Tax=Massilia brevitalea TaxID=442526 RepID=UPI002739C102|nr:DUF192 domain-containing protein [Massilia brevitalea]
MNERPILLHTASGAHPLRVALADGFLTRLRGLMLAPPLAPDAGLLLTRCASVHCAFMRQAIDVVYLDAAGAVLKCVPRVKPWRASAADPRSGARHTLELAAGAIERLGVKPGDRFEHPVLAPAVRPRVRAQAQGGLAMVEFVVVGPMLALIGLGLIQYAMLFFAKNQINHASFMAARAGSMGNANINTVRQEFTRALIPLYGGGTNAAELAASLAKADRYVSLEDVELINPTAESFQDWNEPSLQAKYNTGSKRVIPNASLAFKDQSIRPNSGQTIQDANLLKLRIIHGYEPRIPLARTLFSAYLKAADPHNDPTYTKIVQKGFIPVVTNVTLHMQSDAIEGSPISAPGAGNGGNPTNPGDPPVSDTPSPPCTGIACNEEVPPDPVDPNAPCTGADCPVCPVV